MSRLALVVMLASIGCESKAKPVGGVATARLSLEGESCANTADCAGTLRCVDRVCSEAGRSDVGDYHLAAAQRLLAKGDNTRAIVELRAAEAEYKRLGKTPTDVDCQLGAALAGLRADPLKAEEAAAKLHRCVVALIDGSQSRDQALSALTLLSEVGFDPSHLAGAAVADRYLTLAPERPKLDKLVVTVSADKKSSRKTFVDFIAKIESADAKSVIGPCWQAYWEASKSESLTVSLPYAYSFYLDPDEQSRDRGTLKAKAQTPSDPALAAATACIDKALQPLADQVSRRGGEYRWSSNISIRVGP